MLQGELIFGNLKLGDPIKLETSKYFLRAFLSSYQKNNAVLVEKLLQTASFVNSISLLLVLCFQPGNLFQAAPNFG
jgi:hypothetical protein